MDAAGYAVFYQHIVTRGHSPSTLSEQSVELSLSTPLPRLNLSNQVLRQGSFVQKMHDLGWTAPGFFDKIEDEVALKHAVVRYHA